MPGQSLKQIATAAAKANILQQRGNNQNSHMTVEDNKYKSTASNNNG